MLKEIMEVLETTKAYREADEAGRTELRRLSEEWWKGELGKMMDDEVVQGNFVGVVRPNGEKSYRLTAKGQRRAAAERAR